MSLSALYSSLLCIPSYYISGGYIQMQAHFEFVVFSEY